MYKSWILKLDYVLILLMVVLVVYGLIIIYSANNKDMGAGSEFIRQIRYFVIGLVFLILFASIDYQFWVRMEPYLYLLNLLILGAVLVAGKEALGAQRWISIGGFTFQPSEFAKILMILCLAIRLSDEDALQTEKLVGTLIYLGIPMALIMKQPDLGTALVLIAILFAMLFVRGLNPAWILASVAAGMGISPFVLKEYQKTRLLVFLNPDVDPTGSGWNIRQSMIGIGSGKLWGKGLLFGTQTQLQFVPEHSRDFIFTVLGEELGFMGGASLIALYFFLLLKILKIAQEARDFFGTLIATGVGAMLFFHVFINIGMTMGIMPVTGIPLPFLSYGGSAIITNMMAIGLLLSISLRKEQFFK
ncbi:MAG: rod shape-determining protein RodA [Firmicutes bacterium]|nr:rod shape-determining protein RodA [Bacillota bacterium]